MIEYGPDVYEGNWSYYQNYPWQLYNQGGSKVMVMKATMGYGDSSEPYLTNCFNYHKDAGFKIGLYGWADPTAPLGNQLTRFETLVNRFHPDFVAMDMEQYWQQWSQYWKYLNGEITDSQVDKFAPTYLNQFYGAYYEGIRKFGLLALAYTAAWFVSGYVRPAGLMALVNKLIPGNQMASADRILSNMPPDQYKVSSSLLKVKLPGRWEGLATVGADWMAGVNLWEALYYDKNRPRISVNWNDFKIQMDAVPWNGTGTVPYMPSKRTVWQIGSQWKANGIGGYLDMNKFCPEFIQMLEGVVPPTPSPSPAPEIESLRMVVTTTSNLNIRANHSTSSTIVGSMATGTEFEIVNVYAPGEMWGQLPDGTWAALTYNGQVLAKKV